ncbi:hypothetical protein [Neobacillus mesonae]|uniref:Antitoxin n=1 Tax=Neobacillus mesonae TaxID=1193713 RepID=A0A3Q9QR01_9BACI|nr:hypothetical protein [Neobacillus mesonae]AZU61092.1 hypothetical protein CHR53_07395 [Neobacillus mesonae]
MRKIQPVSFSLSDQFEEALYKHAIKNGPFSKYIKRLIQRDMERGIRITPTKKAPAQPNVIHGSTNALNGFVLKS